MNNLSVWNISAADYPLSGSIQEKLAYFVGWGILAPSAHNAQSWEVAVEGSRLTVKLASERLLTDGDPVHRECIVSLGTFITNIIKAAEAFGFKVSTSLVPEGHGLTDVMAYLDFEQVDSARQENPDQVSLDKMTSRMVNRGPYSEQPLAPEAKQALQGLFDGKEASLHLLEDKEAIERTCRLLYEATAFALDNGAFRNELYRHLTDAEDGNPIGIPLETSSMRISKAEFEAKPSLLPEADRDTFLRSAALGIICTDADDQESWIRTGMAFEELALELGEHGLSVSVSAAPIEAPGAYRKLQEIFQTDKRPQFFFRIGYKTMDFPHSPRLEANKVIISIR